MKITIYGPGCAKCNRAEQLIRETLDEIKCPAEIEKITDPRAIATAGVLSTPAIAVDGVVKISGYVPPVREILRLVGR